MENIKKMPVKRQKSLHLYINCKSILEQKKDNNINICSNNNNNSIDIPLLNSKFDINNIVPRKQSYQTKPKLKPIIKDKIENKKMVSNSPLILRHNKNINKLKQRIRHSSKSGVTMPYYMKSKFQSAKKSCINKENKNSDKDITLNSYLDKEEEKIIKIKLNAKIDIIYNSENCITETQKGFSILKNTEKEYNQDCSLIIENVCGIKGYNIYCIMDGHGSNGHLVSNYIKDKIIQYLTDISFYFKKIKPKEKKPLEYPENILELITKKLEKKDYQKIKDFYKIIDESLSSIEVHFDSNFSGSTCLILFQLGNKIISCNVGDSRALLIKENKEIIELSKDQKPDDENEKKRIESMGGIVSQCNDLYDDGKEGGPFRIWMKGCDYPGIAMSRSIGDKIAHNIGVINEPEILSFCLDENSKYFILGSDGVWQHLNNNDIIDIIFGLNSNEKENLKENVCKKIINASTKKFIENNEGVDDITLSFVIIK